MWRIWGGDWVPYLYLTSLDSLSTILILAACSMLPWCCWWTILPSWCCAGAVGASAEEVRHQLLVSMLVVLHASLLLVHHGVGAAGAPCFPGVGAPAAEEGRTRSSCVCLQSPDCYTCGLTKNPLYTRIALCRLIIA